MRNAGVLRERRLEGNTSEDARHTDTPRSLPMPTAVLRSRNLNNRQTPNSFSFPTTPSSLLPLGGYNRFVFLPAVF